MPAAMWRVAAACALAATLVFVNTFTASFVYDDNRAILANDDIRPSTPITRLLLNDFWGTPLRHSGSHKSYRPLTVLTFRLNYLVGGLKPLGYHVANVLLHALVSGLLPVWAMLGPRVPRATALLAGLLFAVHPVHCEAVAGVVGRAELAATAAMLLALIAFHKNHLPLTVTLSGVALLFKEQGLMTLPLCAVFHLLRRRRSVATPPADRVMATMAAAFLAQLLLRFCVMGATLPHFSSADNPAAHARSLSTRLLTFLHLPVINFGLLLWPAVLSFDWSMDAVPLVTSLTDWRNAASLLFYLSLGGVTFKCALALRKWTQLDRNDNKIAAKCKCGSEQLAMALAVVVLTYLPIANLVGYVGFVVAERTLYAPSVGICLLVAMGASKLWSCSRSVAKRTVLVALAICLLLSLAAKTWQRNADWRDEEALYRSGIAVNPPKAYGNLGSVLSSKGRVAEAEFCYRQALEHRPNMADVHYNLGLLLLGQQRLDESISSFKNAINFRPKLAAAHVSLGVALGQAKRPDEAREAFLSAVRLDGRELKDPKSHESARISALFHLGRQLLEQEQPQHALPYLLQAKDQMPNHYQPQSVYNLLGEAYSRLGQHAKAEPWLQASLASKPDHIPAHLNYGKILAANKSRAHEAETWYRRALHLAPHDSNVLRHYGQYLMQQERYGEAAGFLESVVNATSAQQGRAQYHDLINLATALRLTGRLQQAEHFYYQATALEPHNPSSHINLGAILHLQEKFAQAEESYLKALDLEPGDEITLLNLKRLRNLARRPHKSVD